MVEKSHTLVVSLFAAIYFALCISGMGVEKNVIYPDKWTMATRGRDLRLKRDCLFRARLPANTNLRYFVPSTVLYFSLSLSLSLG